MQRRLDLFYSMLTTYEPFFKPSGEVKREIEELQSLLQGATQVRWLAEASLIISFIDNFRLLN